MNTRTFSDKLSLLSFAGAWPRPISIG